MVNKRGFTSIHVQFRPEIAQKIRILAAFKDISVSEYIRAIIEAKIEKINLDFNIL